MKILILNALEWGAEYDSSASFNNVGAWFVEAFGATSAKFSLWRIQQETAPPQDDFDGIVLGGSFSSVFDELPWIRTMELRVHEWIQAEKAILGVCFGHQLIARILGGKVERNPAGWECGTTSVELTDAGRNDPLFQGLPESFATLQAHQDAVLELPRGAEPLASSQRTSIQAFRYGPRIRTIQFHPEFTDAHMRYIFQPHREDMIQSGVDFDSMLSNLIPTPHCRKLFHNFLDEIVQPSMLASR